jgi:hypothetical protein
MKSTEGQKNKRKSFMMAEKCIKRGKMLPLKRQCNAIFDPRFFSSNYSPHKKKRKSFMASWQKTLFKIGNAIF